MISELFGIVSSAIIAFAALVTVLVAYFQVRTPLVAMEKSNSLPVASAVFHEFRSKEFRDHLLRVRNEKPPVGPEGGFQALPEEYRKSAYEVAYFFEHLGALVAYGLVPEDLVVDFSANAVVRSWEALGDSIRKERERRKREEQKRGEQEGREYGEHESRVGLSVNFVSHFEHLAVLASRVDPYGKHVDDSIHERLGLQKFPLGIESDSVK